MGLRPYSGFVGPSYTSESKIAAYDRTVNWYAESIESGTGTARYVLYPTPGFFPQVTGLDSPGRGMVVDVTTITGPSSQSIANYFVSGSTLYEYPSTGRAFGLGQGLTSPVSMTYNGVEGHQILYSVDDITYCFDTSTTTNTNVGRGTSVDFLGGYGLRLNSQLNQFEFSASFDFSTWDPLDIVRRSDSPDNWLRLIVYHNEVWLFGERTTSVYYLSDDPAIPFQPITTAFINRGIVAPDSATIVDGTLMWVGAGIDGSGIVYRANGYNGERESTHPVEYAFESGTAGSLSLAEGCTYQQNGHVFYELTLPSQVDGPTGSTWVLDVTEGLWAERGARNGLQFREMDTRGYFSGLTLSRSEGKVFSVVPTYSYGTDELPIVRLRRAPHILSAQNRIRYSHLRVLMETGITTIAPPAVGSDPTIALRWSDDGGQTWGTTYTTSVGRIGEYSTLVDFRQLGQARDRIFEFRCSAPIPYRLIDAYLDYTVGPS